MKKLTEYYQKHQRKASKKACERYQHLSEEEKKKKQQHAPKRYRNLSVDEKKKV